MVRSFWRNVNESSSKNAEIADSLENSLKGTLTSRKKRCIDGNFLYLLVVGVESERSEPELAIFFT